MSSSPSSDISRLEFDVYFLLREESRANGRLRSLERLLFAVTIYDGCIAALCIDKLAVYGPASASVALIASGTAVIGAAWGFGTKNDYLVMPTLRDKMFADLQKQFDSLKSAIAHSRRMRILKERFLNVSFVFIISAMSLAFLHRVFPNII